MEASPPTCVLKFTATWCGPCQNPEMKNFLHETADKYNVILIEVDVDENPDLANKYNVSSIPLIVGIKENNEFDRCIGFNKEKIDYLFSQIKKNTENQIVLPILKKAEVTND